MLAIKVLFCTIFGLYCIGVAINAYQQFADEDDDWEDIDEIEEEVVYKVLNQEKFILRPSTNEEWSDVEYSNNVNLPKPKTGKDLELEIND